MILNPLVRHFLLLAEKLCMNHHRPHPEVNLMSIAGRPANNIFAGIYFGMDKKLIIDRKILFQEGNHETVGS